MIIVLSFVRNLLHVQICTDNGIITTQQTRPSSIRGHLQTIVCTLNVIVTLLPDPPPPLLLTSHFINLLKISNYVPKARAKYSSLLTKCIANMLELHLFFASFPFCCIRMKLLTSRPRPPPHPLSVTMTLSVQIIVWRCPLNTHTHSLTLTHTHTHTLSHSLTHTHTYTIPILTPGYVQGVCGQMRYVQVRLLYCTLVREIK